MQNLVYCCERLSCLRNNKPIFAILKGCWVDDCFAEFLQKILSMIKHDPDTNLILHSKTFVLELLNLWFCCKPEQSADEQSSFFTSSTFFGRPSRVTGTSPQTNIVHKMQHVVLWWDLKFPWDWLIWSNRNTDMVMLNECNLCVSLWNSLHNFFIFSGITFVVG